MVSFEVTSGGYKVVVGGKTFGNISKERGFFTGPAVAEEFLEVSSDDLRLIADAAEEVRKEGML